MEPPVAFEADAVRDEKLKVLKALRHIPESEIDAQVVRAPVRRRLDRRASTSPATARSRASARRRTTETFVALKLFIDSWRWAGRAVLPALGQAAAQAGHRDRHPLQGGAAPAVRRARGEGIAPQRAQRSASSPTRASRSTSARSCPARRWRSRRSAWSSATASSFGVEPPEAYERLLLDCLLGDGTLFTRGDEVEASWTWISRIHQRWAEQAAAGNVTRRPTPPAAGDPRRPTGARRRRAGLEAAMTAAGACRRQTPSGSRAASQSPSRVGGSSASWRSSGRTQAGHGRWRAARCCARRALERGHPARGRTRSPGQAAGRRPSRPAVPVRRHHRSASTTAPAATWPATIESNVVSQPGGGRVVYSEEITLAGRHRRRGRTSARWCARCRSPASRPPRSGSTRRCRRRS